MNRIICKLCIRTLQFWVELCEIRLMILDHAIETAATPKAKDKLMNERNKMLISNHAAQFRIMRFARQRREN